MERPVRCTRLNGAMITVEICVEGAEAAAEAARGGADRVELCTNLAIGGTTPDPVEIATACESLSKPVHVLIRPRGGDFTYSRGEIARMRRDIARSRELGAAGVVLGVLTSDKRVDRSLMEALIAASRPLKVTFHKAFDETPDPFEALERLIELGVDRVLTSGQASAARSGLPMLAGLVRAAAERIAIMAGGRLTKSDIGPMLRAGLRELHFGSAGCRDRRIDSGRVRQLVEQAHREYQELARAVDPGGEGDA